MKNCCLAGWNISFDSVIHILCLTCDPHSTITSSRDLWDITSSWQFTGDSGQLLLLFSCSVVFNSFATPWTIAHQTPLSMRIPWILQARILEWIAISSSRGSSWPRDRTLVSCIGRRIFYLWATRKPILANTVRQKIEKRQGKQEEERKAQGDRKKKSHCLYPLQIIATNYFTSEQLCQSKCMHEPNRQLRHIVKNVICIMCRKGENKASDLFVLGNRRG